MSDDVQKEISEADEESKWAPKSEAEEDSTPEELSEANDAETEESEAEADSEPESDDSDDSDDALDAADSDDSEEEIEPPKTEAKSKPKPKAKTQTKPDSDSKEKSKKTGRKEIPKVGTGDVVIAARRLSLWYGQIIGINDITLDIGSGVLGLLGPNGAGKSTFLKVMTGQLQPSTGNVAVHGKIIWNNPDVMSKIGFVPEQDAFYEDMTGREFVTYLTQLQGYPKAEAEKLADEAIEAVTLSDQAHRRIREYSKGMRQRIKIAQALAHKPEILFLDEPLAGTDPVGRRHIINLIRGLGEEGRTVVVSSHILHEVEQMTNNIVLINKGRVVADGNIYRIREMIDEHPHTIFVDCDKPREFAAIMAKFDDVVSMEFATGGVHIATSAPDECYSRIPQLALEQGISIRRITSPDNNLMSVFKYLVN